MKEIISKLKSKVPPRVRNAAIGLAFAVGCLKFPPLAVIAAGGALAVASAESVKDKIDDKEDISVTAKQQAEAKREKTKGNSITQDIAAGLTKLSTPPGMKNLMDDKRLKPKTNTQTQQTRPVVGPSLC